MARANSVGVRYNKQIGLLDGHISALGFSGFNFRKLGFWRHVFSECVPPKQAKAQSQLRDGRAPTSVSLCLGEQRRGGRARECRATLLGLVHRRQAGKTCRMLFRSNGQGRQGLRRWLSA
eukprot:2538363-Pleurochrysis_carterae.AAC.1